MSSNLLPASDSAGTSTRPAPQPQTDLVDLFTSLDRGEASGSRAADGSGGAGSVFYVDNEPLDLAALVAPPAVLRGQAGTAPVAAPTPAVGQASTAAPAAPVAPAEPLSRLPKPWAGRIIAATVVLALMAVTGWFLARGPLANSHLDPTGTAPAPGTAAPAAAPAPPGQRSIPLAPRQSDYAAVIAAVRGATTLAGLSTAADRATTLSQEFVGLTGATEAGTALIRAQTSALQAFASLDALTAANAGAQFPAVMTTLTSATEAVTRARAALPGEDPGTDTVPATRQVRRVLAPLAIDRLTAQVRALVQRAGKATSTADLRAVAADSFRTRVAAEDTAAVLHASGRQGRQGGGGDAGGGGGGGDGGGGELAERAAHLVSATTALAALKAIDGDHLAAWTPISADLSRALAPLGLPNAPVQRVDQFVAAAQLRLRAWEALRIGPDTATLTTYGTRLRSAFQTWTSTWATLPQLRPDQSATADLVDRFRRAARALSAAEERLGRLDAPTDAPAGLTSAHEALQRLTERAAAVARAGLAAATAAARCAEPCALGDSEQWQTYLRAGDQVGDPAPLLAAWQQAYAAAEPIAAAVPPLSSKPVV